MLCCAVSTDAFDTSVAITRLHSSRRAVGMQHSVSHSWRPMCLTVEPAAVYLPAEQTRC